MGSSTSSWIYNWANFGKYYGLSEDINWKSARESAEGRDFCSRKISFWFVSLLKFFLGELWSYRPRFDFIFGEPPAVCKTLAGAILRSYDDYRKNARGHLYGARRGAVRSSVRITASVKYKCKLTNTRICIKCLAACRYGRRKDSPCVSL